MNIQFNLLPDVKQEFLKAQRTKRTAVSIAVVVSLIALVFLLFMLVTVYVINKKQLRDADKDVKKYSDQLKAVPNLNKVLTVQNQLLSLPSLHADKHVVSKLYTYLPQVTPVTVHMSRLTLDLSTNTMEISGTSDSQKSINTFIDTLKFTTYKQDDKQTGNKAFPSVVEKSFGIDQKGASYSLTIQFDPILFSNQTKIEISVPAGLSTTRSFLNDPSNVLFDGAPLPDDQNNPSNNQPGAQ